MANVVVVGPHPDDQEAGMGGTVALLASQGHRVLLLDMTNGEPTPLGSVEGRRKEAEASLKVLNDAARKGKGDGFPGVVERMCLGFPNRELQHSVGARHVVAKVYREWQADVVFAPFFEDAHPDHVATTRIAEDARFDAKLSRMGEAGRWRGGEVLRGKEVEEARRGVHTPSGEWFGRPADDARHPPKYPKWFFHYYATHLRWVMNPSFCLDITGFEGVKRAAIEAYVTQFVRANGQVVGWIEAAGTYLGSRIGTRSAEGFYTREPVGLRGLEGVV
ncbi:MAG: PIG-L family deacetylase [Phycisphaerales bacterium]